MQLITIGIGHEI